LKRQPPGTINVPPPEESAIPEDTAINRESTLNENEDRRPLDDPSLSPDPESFAGPEIEAGSEAGLSTRSRPLLEKVMHDISASLQELQAVVRETDGFPADEDLTPHESALETADRRYQDLFELAPDAYLVTDDQMFIQESNLAAAALLQMSQASLQGKPLSHFIVAEDRPAFQASLSQLREGGEKRNWELRLQSGEGPPLLVRITVRAQTDHHDKLVRMLWLLRDAREGKVEVDTLRSLLSGLKSSLHGIVEAFATAVEMKDPQIAGHQRRVAQLAVAIAREMGFSLNQLEGIKIAGLLHDIGKIAIPTEILNKPGVINRLEYEFIKSHCQVGYDLLKDIDFPWPIPQAILQHHERLNGSGYPAGLTDADIIPEARILGVADVMEAMVCERPFGPAQGIDKALEEIHENTGILYDPEVVNICVKLFVEKGFNFNLE
jgi:putative nucleotidyltransferase with HDIG domain/PAS domain S-box-containing protein